MSTSDGRYTAVIHAADGIRFAAAAASEWSLAWRIVDYIEERCDYTLWPVIAAEVRALIAANQPYAAIAVYFHHVGARWDQEFLELGGPAADILSVPRSQPRRRARSPVT